MLTQSGLVRVDAVGAQRCYPDAESRALLEVMANWARALLAKEASYCAMLRTWLPYRMAGLLSPDNDVRDSTLDLMERCWLSLPNLSGALSRFKKQLYWPLGVWPMEMLAGVAECGFEDVPGDVKQEMYDCYRHHGTKAIEDLFNNISASSRGSSGGKLNHLRLWHKAIHAGVLEDADVTVVKRQPEDRKAHDPLPKQIFSAATADCSLGKVELNEFLNDKHMPMYGPKTHEHLPPLTACSDGLATC